jgi:hypothetical protein
MSPLGFIHPITPFFAARLAIRRTAKLLFAVSPRHSHCKNRQHWQESFVGFQQRGQKNFRRPRSAEIGFFWLFTCRG